MTDSTLLTQKQAASALGVSTRTLEKWRYQGGGPLFVSLSPRCVRYRREDLQAWIQDRIRKSTCDTGEW